MAKSRTKINREINRTRSPGGEGVKQENALPPKISSETVTGKYRNRSPERLMAMSQPGMNRNRSPTRM